MRKIASLLMVLILMIALLSVGCTSNAIQTGIIKSFDDKKITISSDDKVSTFNISEASKITQQGNPVNYNEAMRKGIKVDYKLSGKDILQMDLSQVGEETAGNIEFSVVSSRAMFSESPTPPKANDGEIVNIKEIGEEEDSSYGVYKGTVELGEIALVPGTLEVTFGGKSLKVLEGAVEYNKSIPDDEVKVIDDSGFIMLEFEKTPQEYYIDEFQKTLELKYKKKQFEVVTTEVSNLSFNENVTTTLNGVEVPFLKAMNRGNYFYTVSNIDGEVVFLDAFYKELECTVNSVNEEKLGITVLRNGKEIFKDEINIVKDTVITDSNNKLLKLDGIKVADKLKISVAPEKSYKVISIMKLK